MIPFGIQAAVLAVAVVSAFGAGWRVHDWKVSASLLADKEKAIKELRVVQAEFNKKSDELERARADLQKVRDETVVEVEKIVTRPVYVNECFDADGMRALQNAIRRKSVGPAKPASAVR